MLQESGYGILAIDQRGHGDSTGQTNRFGWEGNKDIQASVTFLEETKKINSICGLGLSMGAEVLLGSASNNPKIKAIIAEGATYRSFEEFKSLESNAHPIRSISPLVVKDLTLKLVSGQKEPNTILDSITHSESYFLFIAAGKRSEGIEFNSYYQEKTTEQSELWIIEDADHIQGINAEKELYEQKVLEFFDEYCTDGQ